MCVCVCSVTPDSTTSWTVACLAPLSMGVSRQEHWNEWVTISSRPRDQTRLLRLLHWKVDSLPGCHLGSPFWYNVFLILNISFLTIFPYKAIWNHIENINYKILFISVPYLYSSSFEQLNLFNWWFLFILKYKSRKKEMSFSSEKHAGNFGGRIVDSVLAHFLNQGQVLGLL